MSLWRLFYHIVWSTREREPLISAEIEPVLYGYMIGKISAMNSIVHAVGGIEDHIHLVVSIPPTLAISDFVQRVKGSSAHHINQQFPHTEPRFGWQRGYGVFSLGERQLDRVLGYVRRQKEHHANHTCIAALEQTDDDTDTAQ